VIQQVQEFAKETHSLGTKLFFTKFWLRTAIPSAPARIKRLVMVCVYSGPDGRYTRRFHRETVLAQSQGRVALLQEISSGAAYFALPSPRKNLCLCQQIAQPEADLRSSVCDGLEIARRGGRQGLPYPERGAERAKRRETVGEDGGEHGPCVNP
jgi:hypothetical protein